MDLKHVDVSPDAPPAMHDRAFKYDVLARLGSIERRLTLLLVVLTVIGLALLF